MKRREPAGETGRDSDEPEDPSHSVMNNSLELGAIGKWNCNAVLLLLQMIRLPVQLGYDPVVQAILQQSIRRLIRARGKAKNKVNGAKSNAQEAVSIPLLRVGDIS